MRRFASADNVLLYQHENGGWPQYHPLREGYYEHITFNDGAMIGALRVLRDVAVGRPPFAFVDAERRAEAEAAVDRGIDLILRTGGRTIRRRSSPKTATSAPGPSTGGVRSTCATLRNAWSARTRPGLTDPSLRG